MPFIFEILYFEGWDDIVSPLALAWIEVCSPPLCRVNTDCVAQSCQPRMGHLYSQSVAYVNDLERPAVRTLCVSPEGTGVQKVEDTQGARASGASRTSGDRRLPGSGGSRSGNWLLPAPEIWSRHLCGRQSKHLLPSIWRRKRSLSRLQDMMQQDDLISRHLQQSPY